MEKEQVAQQCHDLQQELAMEGDHRQEMSEEVRRLKKELNSRFSDYYYYYYYYKPADYITIYKHQDMHARGKDTYSCFIQYHTLGN